MGASQRFSAEAKADENRSHSWKEIAANTITRGAFSNWERQKSKFLSINTARARLAFGPQVYVHRLRSVSLGFNVQRLSIAFVSLE